MIGFDRKEAAENHRLDLAVTRQRLASWIGLRRQRVADAQQCDVLDPGDHVANLACQQLGDADHLRREESDVVDLRFGTGDHRLDRLALSELSIDDADVGNDAAVLIELGINNQRARRSVWVAAWRRHVANDRLEHLLDALPCLAGDLENVVGRLTE